MTQAEKMQLRLIAILDQSRVSWGDQANTINSLANQMRILENNMSEISLVLGQLFVPLMEKALPIVNGLTRAIKNLLVNLAGILGIKIDPDKFGQGFTEIEDNFEGITEGTEEAEKALEEYKNQLLGFDEVNKLQDVDAKAILDTEQTGGIDLTEEILAATEEYEKFWQEAFANMEDYSTQWEEYFSKFAEPIEKIFTDIALGDWFSLGGDVSKPITEIQLWFQEALNGVDWEGIGKKFGDFFTSSSMEASVIFGDSSKTISQLIIGINNFLTSAISSIQWGEILGSIIDGLTDFFKNLDVSGIVSSLYDVFGAIGGAITDIVDWILDNPKEFAELFGAFFQKVFELVVVLIAANIELIAKSLADIIATMMENAINKFKETKENAEKFGNALGKVFKDGAEAWKNGTFPSWLAETIKSAIRKALEAVKTTFGSVAEFFSPITNGIKEVFSDLPSYFSSRFGEMANSMRLGFQNIGSNAKLGLEEKWNELKLWFKGTAVVQWWQEVAKLFPASEWKALFSDITAGLKMKWDETVKWFKGSAAGQLLGAIRTNLTMENFRDSMGSIKEAFTRRWNSLKTWFSGTALVEWWNTFTENFKKEKWVNALSGVKTGFEEAFNAAVAAVKQIWNTFANYLNAKLTWTIAPVKVMGKTLFTGTTIDLGKVPTFMTGGFPEDGLFFANHNELVGKFANGKTAVANNEQITQGIEQASYRGMTRALAEYQGNGGTVNVVLQGDADGLFKVVQSKADNYTMQTGRPAFII